VPSLSANQVSPFDATPDPTGATLYFTGLSNTAGAAPIAGVYTAPAGTTAATPTVVQAGAPYVSPWGISTSTDGTMLYVADPGADITLDTLGQNQIAGGSDGGAILVQPKGGGAPTTLMGSAGYDPRGVEVLAVGGSDIVYFSGRNPTTGKVGVYSLPAAGAATPTTVLEGAPLGEPGGVAIGSDGTVYVADSLGPGGIGQVVSIAKGATTGTQLVGGLRLGFPSGIALSLDGKALLVSALDPVAATDVIVQFPIATPAMQTLITMTISTGTEAAGLHRARTVDVFGFADGTAGAVGPSGTTAAVLGGAVYTVK
jgi:sugar lactone lactonase YvrE